MITSVDHGEVRFFRMARTYAGRALYWTGIYLVDGLLVDSGPANLGRAVARLIRELPVRQCVTTHHHEDHVGNHHLLEALGITPLAHAAGVGLIAAPATPLPFYRRVVWGTPAPARAAPISEWLETPGHRFQVLHTPGHAEDHIALYEPDREWLFSGDLYLAPRLKYLRADEDAHALLASLRRVAALRPKALFCQHRGRVADGAAMLARKLDFLVELVERIADLRARGLDEDEIARALPGSDLVWRVWSGGEFAKRHFVRSFLRPRAEPGAGPGADRPRGDGR